jgi:uncharacterized protein with PQ loop repeat
MNRVDFIGYAGLVLLQLNYVPAIYQAIKTGETMPIASLLFSIAGLSCYLYNSVKLKNTLYTIGNAIGLLGNLILLGMVVTK